MKRSITLCLLLLSSMVSMAGEGMWFPQLLEQLNESDMRQLGMQITAKDIYDVNQTSIKDAVLQFGGGCTGEIISDRGLLITNHHCGFSTIQSLSTIEKNYLENGYWAMNDSSEIPCPGLTVTFIREIKDVTSVILQGIDDSFNEEARIAIIKFRSDSVEKVSVTSKNLKAFVKTFYSGNEYFLFIAEVFKDVRFVGAPPASVGKFGGETDNWMWPRHTGDFSLFRIYADSLNRPADFSKSNVPYKPKKVLEINIGEKKEGDFVFTYGFPGTTKEYVTASSLDLVFSQTNPNKIRIRDERLNVWREDMYSNDTINLKYSSKFKTIANYYKKWIGENQGLKTFDVVNKKKEYENKLDKLSNGTLRVILNKIDSLNKELKPVSHIQDYYTEALGAIEITSLYNATQKLVKLCLSDTSSIVDVKKEAAILKINYRSFCKNYSKPTDRKVCEAMLKITKANVDSTLLPSFYNILKTENDIRLFADKLYYQSLLTDSSSLFSLLDNLGNGKVRIKISDPIHKWSGEFADSIMSVLDRLDKKKIKKITDDPVYKFGKEITDRIATINSEVSCINGLLLPQNRNYIAAIRHLDKERKFYPDANSTLRVSYGKLSGTTPEDGMVYKYYTTTDGILAKIDRTKPDFDFPKGLEEIIRNKDFGRYAKNGSVPVAFIASNHTTGGNSGSPVLNAKGQLIGINFDRIWEGNMSDYFYDESTCRNVSMDMNYFLFVVEKFGKADRLIKEMKIVY